MSFVSLRVLFHSIISRSRCFSLFFQLMIFINILSIHINCQLCWLCFGHSHLLWPGCMRLFAFCDFGHLWNLQLPQNSRVCHYTAQGNQVNKIIQVCFSLSFPQAFVEVNCVSRVLCPHRDCIPFIFVVRVHGYTTVFLMSSVHAALYLCLYGYVFLSLFHML